MLIKDVSWFRLFLCSHIIFVCFWVTTLCCVSVFAYCVFVFVFRWLCFCVKIYFVCVSMLKSLCMCFCVPVQCLCFLVLVHCVWLNVLCTCFWVPILCVCFLCFHTRRVLLNKWNNLVGITSLLLQCHPGKNNPMILRLMFTT